VLRRLLALAGLAACSPGATVAPEQDSDAHSATGPTAPSVWSNVVGDAAEHPAAGRWLAPRLRAGEPVLVVLGDGGLRFEDAEGRRLAAIATPGLDSAALATSRAIVFLGGPRRIAAVDLLEDDLRVAVLSGALAHEGYAVKRARGHGGLSGGGVVEGTAGHAPAIELLPRLAEALILRASVEGSATWSRTGAVDDR